MHRGVDGSLPRVHHAPGEQPHIVAGGRRGRVGSQRRSAGTPRRVATRFGARGALVCASREQSAPTRPCSRPVMTEGHASPSRCHHGVNRPAAASESARSPPSSRPKGHARRARRLAPPALHAGVHEARRTRRRAPRPSPLHLAHRRDPAAVGRRLLARHPVRRAVREGTARTPRRRRASSSTTPKLHGAELHGANFTA